jgi:hypothetical protein
MVKGIGINAMPLHHALKVPELLKWCALRWNYNNNNNLVRHQKTHGDFARAFESFSDSYCPLA